MKDMMNDKKKNTEVVNMKVIKEINTKISDLENKVKVYIG